MPISQAVIIYLLALLLGVKMNWSPLALLGVLATVILGAAMFSTDHGFAGEDP